MMKVLVVAMVVVQETIAFVVVAVVAAAGHSYSFGVSHDFEGEYYKYDSFQDNYHHFPTQSMAAFSLVLMLKKNIVTSKKNTLILQQD